MITTKYEIRTDRIVGNRRLVLLSVLLYVPYG